MGSKAVHMVATRPTRSASDMIHCGQFGRVGQSPQFRERPIVEHMGDGVAGLDHDLPDCATFEVATVLARPVGGDRGAGDGRERPVENANDIADADLVRRTGQGVAAAPPFLE